MASQQPNCEDQDSLTSSKSSEELWLYKTATDIYMATTVSSLKKTSKHTPTQANSKQTTDFWKHPDRMGGINTN